MSFRTGGKGGKELRDTELSEDLVGDDDVTALIYESIVKGRPAVWVLTKPVAKKRVVVQEHDCRVSEGGTQSMLFARAEDNTQPPFYALCLLSSLLRCTGAIATFWTKKQHT